MINFYHCANCGCESSVTLASGWRQRWTQKFVDGDTIEWWCPRCLQKEQDKESTWFTFTCNECGARACVKSANIEKAESVLETWRWQIRPHYVCPGCTGDEDVGDSCPECQHGEAKMDVKCVGCGKEVHLSVSELVGWARASESDRWWCPDCKNMKELTTHTFTCKVCGRAEIVKGKHLGTAVLYLTSLGWDASSTHSVCPECLKKHGSGSHTRTNPVPAGELFYVENHGWLVACKQCGYLGMTSYLDVDEVMNEVQRKGWKKAKDGMWRCSNHVVLPEVKVTVPMPQVKPPKPTESPGRPSYGLVDDYLRELGEKEKSKLSECCAHNINAFFEWLCKKAPIIACFRSDLDDKTKAEILQSGLKNLEPVKEKVEAKPLPSTVGGTHLVSGGVEIHCSSCLLKVKTATLQELDAMVEYEGWVWDEEKSEWVCPDCNIEQSEKPHGTGKLTFNLREPGEFSY